MADEPEGTPDEIQDSPVETNAPAPADSADASQQGQIDWDSEDNPYNKRFRDTQAELTRRSQYLSDLEDPESEAFQEFLAKNGFELAEDDEEPDEDPDPFDPEYLHRKILTLEEREQQREQAKQQQEQMQKEAERLSREVDSVFKAESIEASENEKQLLFRLSAQTLDDRGKPNVKAAYEQLYGEFLSSKLKARGQRKKRAAQAPAGREGQRQVNLKNDQERLAAMADAAEEAMHDEG